MGVLHKHEQLYFTNIADEEKTSVIANNSRENIEVKYLSAFQLLAGG